MKKIKSWKIPDEINEKVRDGREKANISEPYSSPVLYVSFSVLIHSVKSTWSDTNEGIWHLNIAVLPRITKTS
jgi:hypothetical protein